MSNFFIQAIIPVMSGVIALITWLYQKEKEKRISVQNQLSEKKYQVYNEIFNLFFGLFQNTLRNEQYSQQQMEESMLSIVKGLTIYGSESVLKTFSSWKRSSTENASPQDNMKSFKKFLDVLIAIRKDMGNYNSKVNYDDILGMIVIDYDNAKAQFGF